MLNHTDKQLYLDKFKELIFKKYPINKINELLLKNNNLLRILIAKEFKLNDSFCMFEEINEWRNIELCKHINNINIDNIKKIKEIFPSYWLSTDKLGNPVYIECPGANQITNLLEITTIDTLISIYIKNYEYMMNQIYPKLERTNKLIQTITIIDLKGVSIRSLNNGFYTYLKKSICIGCNYYPETTYKIFIINTPYMFYTIWTVIKVFIPKKTLDKIHILSQDKKHELYEYIDRDKLPDNLEFSNKIEQSKLEKEYFEWLDI
jgi:hypothetical protein